jgi:hypothetical protein
MSFKGKEELSIGVPIGPAHEVILLSQRPAAGNGGRSIRHVVLMQNIRDLDPVYVQRSVKRVAQDVMPQAQTRLVVRVAT